MNLTSTNTLIKACMILLLCAISIVVSGKDDLKSMSDYLDYIIINKQQFIDQKEQRINDLKNLLKKNDTSLEYEYEINQKLFGEYKKLKLDSAIFYAERNVQLADQLNCLDLKNKSNINLATIYSYAGRYRESEEILKNISSRQLSSEALPDYYEAYSRFFEHYGAVSNQCKYAELIEKYRDSLLMALDPASFKYKVNMVHRHLNQAARDKTEKSLFDLLATVDADTPEYALVTHYLGAFYGIISRPELEKKYYILSATADIKNAIKENASFQRLALIYYKNGEISKAFTYAQSAIEDAVYSGVQFRATEMSKLYSIINASNQVKETKAKEQLRLYLLLISLLTLFLILLVLYIYKQMKKLSSIKEVLSQTNTKLMELNKELNEVNNQLNEVNDQLNDKNELLLESNHIKEQYIAQFFNLCSTYIDKMEDYRKTLFKLGINKQYEELIKKLKSTTVVDNELDELYSQFDSIFSKLYPTFVSEFNSLLAKDEQVNLKTDSLLNKELRIYALLRLGITDSVKIAGFLRCSISTVYNYRTKMRNKAATNREEFEDQVMKIGIMNWKTD